MNKLLLIVLSYLLSCVVAFGQENQPIVIEAETGVVAGVAKIKPNCGAGNGSGQIVQLHDPTKIGAANNTLTLSDIEMTKAGLYVLSITYFNGAVTPISIEVNGVEQTVDLPKGVFCYEGKPVEHSIGVNLQQGMNTLVFRHMEGVAGPIFDYFSIKEPAPAVLSPKVENMRLKANQDTEIAFVLDKVALEEQTFNIELTGLNGATLSSNTVSFQEGERVASVTLSGATSGTGTIILSNTDDFVYNGEVVNISVTDTPVSFYVSNDGDDSNDGTSEATAWASLANVSNSTYIPGDQILFRKGDTFIGRLVISSSGADGSPITFASYGEGDVKPVLDGAKAEGGSYLSTVYVENQDYLVMRDLHITNDRKVSREGVDDKMAYGIYVLNKGDRTLNHFRFDNLTIANVLSVASLNTVSFNQIEVTGVYLSTERNTEAGKEKKINDVIFENCYVTRVGKLGFKTKHANSKTGAEEEIEELAYNTNIVVRNNHFFETGGSPVQLGGAYNALIEHNIFDYPGFSSTEDNRYAGRGSGSWYFRCRHIVSQYNVSKHVRGSGDSYGQHIDSNNHYVIMQYNYSEDSEGGFVEILGGNKYCTYRYNVSVNDGFRTSMGRGKNGNTLWVSDYWEGMEGEIKLCDEIYIYNNSVLVSNDLTPDIDFYGKSINVFNNAFHVRDNAKIGERIVVEGETALTSDNNLYFGDVSSDFTTLDAAAITGNPRYVMTGENDGDIFRLEENSPALNAGRTIQEPPFPHAGQGIFENITANATKDYFGNPVDLSAATHVGAFNGTALTAVPAEASISIDETTLDGGDEATITVTLNKDVYENQTVDIDVVGVDATGVYTLSDASVAIAQDTRTATSTLTINTDHTNQTAVVGTVSLTNPSAGITLGDNASSPVTILAGEPIASLSDAMATMKLFPNPVVNFVKVETDKQLKATAIIRDFTGKQVIKTSIKDGVIDMNGLLSGMYLLEVQTVDNESLIFKVVKK